jgi:hypothetical protein
MPLRPTPRLCAHCGIELRPADSTVTIEDTRSGEQRLLHRVCFEVAFQPAPTEGDATPGGQTPASERRLA